MWELNSKDSWALKNWFFWTVVLEKPLENPLDCRRSNQSFLKAISPEYSLEGLILKLKLQYFGHLMGRTDSFEKTLMLERLKAGEGDRGWDGWMASLTPWTWIWASFGSWWWTGKCGMLQSMGSQRVGHGWATELKYICQRNHDLYYRNTKSSKNKCFTREFYYICLWPQVLSIDITEMSKNRHSCAQF